MSEPDREFAVSLSEGELTIVADLTSLLELCVAIETLIYHTETKSKVVLNGKAQHVTVKFEQFLPRL